MPLKRQEFEAYKEAIQTGHGILHNGRSASTLAELDFIVQVEGMDEEAAAPAKAAKPEKKAAPAKAVKAKKPAKPAENDDLDAANIMKLRSMAKGLGIELAANAKKADIVAAIRAAQPN